LECGQSSQIASSEVLDASLSISFDQHGAVQPTHSIGCSQLCDPHLNLQKPETPHSSVLAEVSASLPSAEDHGFCPSRTCQMHRKSKSAWRYMALGLSLFFGLKCNAVLAHTTMLRFHPR